MQLDQCRTVPGEIYLQIPHPVLRTDRCDPESKLPAPALKLPGIDQPACCTGGGRCLHVEDLVSVLHLVPGPLKPHPVTEEGQIHASLDRGRNLRLQLRIEKLIRHTDRGQIESRKVRDAE